MLETFERGRWLSAFEVVCREHEAFCKAAEWAMKTNQTATAAALYVAAESTRETLDAINDQGLR